MPNKKKQIFNNKRVTQLMSKYVEDYEALDKLKDKIMIKALPLVGSAISKKGLAHIRGDLQQECALKVLKALPKYNKEKSSAFGFLWTVICNTCLTHAERLSRPSLSLDEDENQREAEAANPSKSPEMVLIQNVLSKAMDEALSSAGFRKFDRSKAKKIQSYLKKAIISGELFSDRQAVIAGLKEIGLDGKGSGFLINKTLVLVRSKLYSQKSDLPHIKSRAHYYHRNIAPEGDG